MDVTKINNFCELYLFTLGFPFLIKSFSNVLREHDISDDTEKILVPSLSDCHQFIMIHIYTIYMYALVTLFYAAIYIQYYF